MADNTTVDVGSGGDVIATDDIGGVKYPRSKITIGADGVNDGDVSAANPMPIKGTGTAGTPNAGVVTVQGIASGTAIPVSGTFTVGTHDVTNAGTFAVQASQAGVWNITNISGTVSLPTGAATSALQATGNASLASMDGKITAVNTGAVVVSSSALPSGAATSANQATEIAGLATLIAHVDALEGLLTTIDADTGTLATVDFATQTTLAALNAKIPASPAQEHATAASPHAARLTDGTAFYKATTPSDTQPVSVASLPLPTGGATAAKQDTGNASLASVDGKITTVNTGAVVVSSSALPTGAATAANQATIIGHVDGLEGLLATIDGDTGNISTKIDTLAGAVAGSEMQVDVLSAVTPTNRTIGPSTIDAVDEAVALAVPGCGSACVIIQGTFAAELVFEATNDGTTWLEIPAHDPSTGNTAFGTEDPGLFIIPAVFAQVRVRVDAYTSGSASVSIVAGAGSNFVFGKISAFQGGGWSIGVATSALPAGAATEASLGTDGSSPPAVLGSGTGIRGWLRSIYEKLTGSIAVTGTFWQATQPVSGTLAATQSGTWTEANSAAIKTAVETLDNAIAGSEMQVDVLTMPTVTVNSHAVTNAGTFAVQVSSALPTGTNAIGKLAANSGVDIGDVDVTSLPALPAGTNNIGDVDVLSLPAIPAGSNNIGDVDVLTLPALVTSTATIGAVQLKPVASGGLTAHKTISAASTNATTVKASAGQLYEIFATNVNASPRYLKLYNKASSPTVGTDVPVWTLLIPGNTAGAGLAKTIPIGLAFATGIAFALTTGVADADTAAVAANEIVINLGYN